MKLLKSIIYVSIVIVLFLSSCNVPKEDGKEFQQNLQSVVSIDDISFSTGQTVYVPVYSQIYSAYPVKEGSRINLAVTLSIRNTDIEKTIIIKSVKYYDNNGKFLKDYIEQPIKLSQMASISFNIKQNNEVEGIGSNFIVEWGAEETVHEPYIEAIMIGTHGNFGFSWKSSGHVLK